MGAAVINMNIQPTKEEAKEINWNIIGERLKELAVKQIKSLIKSKKAFPRFPDSKEIREDFENVVSIKFVTIHF